MPGFLEFSTKSASKWLVAKNGGVFFVKYILFVVYGRFGDFMVSSFLIIDELIEFLRYETTIFFRETEFVYLFLCTVYVNNNIQFCGKNW